MRQKSLLAGIPILVALAGGGFIAHNMMVKAWVDGVTQAAAALPDGWNIAYGDMTIGFFGQTAEFTNVTVTKDRETIVTLAKVKAADFGFRPDNLTIGSLDGTGIKVEPTSSSAVKIANFTIKGVQFPLSVPVDAGKLSIAELRGQDLTYRDAGKNVHLDWFQGVDLQGKNLTSIVIKKLNATEEVKHAVDGGVTEDAKNLSVNQISARELNISTIVDELAHQNFDFDALGPVAIDGFLFETDHKKINMKSIELGGIKKHRLDSVKLSDLSFEKSNLTKITFNIASLEGNDIDTDLFSLNNSDFFLSKKLGFLDITDVKFTSDLGNGSFGHFNMTGYDDRRLAHATLHDFFLSTQGTATTIADQSFDNLDFRAVSNKDGFFNGGFNQVNVDNARIEDFHIVNRDNNFSLNLFSISNFKNGI